jgi:hypothetical protein
MAILSSRGRLRALRAAIRLALLLVAVTQLGACFNPSQPGCAFSCASDGLCPSSYSCGGDLLCHRNDGQGSCAIQTDAAGTDAPRDAAVDRAVDSAVDKTTGQ